MRRFFILIIAVNFIIFSKVSAQGIEKRVCFQEKCFFVELAIARQERERGLMFRKGLDRNKGMLFIFPTERSHSFWMKNTYMPLDIIWINKDKKIVFIKEDARPCLEDSCPILDPGPAALYVLEVNSGVAKSIGLAVGGELDFYIEENHE